MSFEDPERRSLLDVYSDAQDWVLDHTLYLLLGVLDLSAGIFYRFLGFEVPERTEQDVPMNLMRHEVGLYLQVEPITDATTSPAKGLDVIVQKYAPQGIDRETIIIVAMEEAKPLHLMCMKGIHPNLKDKEGMIPGYGDRVWERVDYVQNEFKKLRNP